MLVDNHARAIVKSIEDPFVVVAWPLVRLVRLYTATPGVLEMKTDMADLGTADVRRWSTMTRNTWT